MLKSLIVFGFSALIALLLGLILLDQILLPLVVARGQELEVPDITELPIERARRVLQLEGFNLAVDTTRSDLDVPKGCVIFQDPKAFAKVKRHRRIYVIVSEGPRLYEVPDVSSSGISLRQARLEVDRSGLEVGTVRYRPSYEIERDVVISQHPAPHDSVSKEVVVDLIISSGPPQKRVPDLIGMHRDDAEELLRSRGFILGRVTFEKSNKYLPDSVIRQSPGPNERIAPAEEVNLVVSR